jgi:hypothetical protein
MQIDGELLRQDRSPADKLDIAVFDLGAVGGAQHKLAGARSDQDGAFHMRLRTRELIGPLLVYAVEASRSAPSPNQALGYVGESGGLQLSRAAQLLKLDDARDGSLQAHLVLEALRSIRGRVLEANGSAVKNPTHSLRLSCRRSSATTAEAQPRQLLPQLNWLPDDSFEFSGLTEGDYDLSVSRVQWPTFYSWTGSAQTVRNIAAGRRGVELVLAPQELTKIRVRIVGAKPQSVIALRAKLLDAHSNAPFAAAPRSWNVSGVCGWPVQAPLRFAGISGGTDPLGRWSFGLDEFESVLEFDLPPTDPGVYVFGLQPFSSDAGKGWFTQASAPLHFEAGEYLIEFHPVATARLEGVLVGGAHDQRIGIQLLDSTGAVVPLAGGSGRLRPQLELDAAGHFLIEQAPVGHYILRTGTLADLAQERGRVLTPIEILAADNPLLELHW